MTAGYAIAASQPQVERTDWTASIIAPEPWVQGALCAQTDPEAFFPDKGGSTRDAMAICASCDVAAQCLEYALRTRQDSGIWGGTSYRTRAKMLRGRA